MTTLMLLLLLLVLLLLLLLLVLLLSAAASVTMAVDDFCSTDIFRKLRSGDCWDENLGEALGE
jgi:hypothetical protein